MTDHGPFGRLERRLQLLSATLERETESLRDRIAAWHDEAEWLARQRPTLSSWAAAARGCPLPATYAMVTAEAGRLRRWARLVRAGLRVEHAWLRLRILSRAVAREAAAIAATDAFFVIVVLGLALIVLMVALL